MSLETKKLFLSAPKYAVVGASKDQSKFGTKVLQWYQARNLDVTPVHPKETELEGIPAVQKLSDLKDPEHTSVSVITNAKITLGLLQSAKELGIPALWLQPGAEDDAVVAYIRENGLEDKVVWGGPCVLVEGDGIRSSL
ncbi:NAD-P-binding protein [Cylindrobasidium torrendii FP15055 ss-10]|uniref:NAD-P-binding protein n=1 Tax=Cylindrobasidium torrendii FP15055 ss-10 TaxID=1314674 RepID=A0A0D7BCC1_9AGAR|nr:NAD-P-binding protein [Cylindrobasidium torrendii FP15055 ss-10]